MHPQHDTYMISLVVGSDRSKMPSTDARANVVVGGVTAFPSGVSVLLKAMSTGAAVVRLAAGVVTGAWKSINIENVSHCSYSYV